MKKNEKKSANNKDTIKKKEWKKPVFVTITREEVRKHIQAAARSGGCGGVNSR